MRIKNALALAVGLFIIGTSVSTGGTALADESPMTGNWKLIGLPFGYDEFAIFNLGIKDGKPTATVVDAQQMLRKPTVGAVEQKSGTLMLSLPGGGLVTTFKGRLAKAGPDAGKFLGTVNLGGTTYPARVERTEDTKVAPLKQSPMIAKLTEIQKESDAKSRITQIEDTIRGNHGHPNNALLYRELLKSATAVGYEPAKIEELVKRWTGEASPYGDDWLNEVRFRIVRSIASRKNLAKITVELTKELDKAAPDAAVDAKVTVLGFLAKAAKDAGMEKLAEEADARRLKIDNPRDEEYKKSVPPFKPAAFPGRKDASANQTVLMELFTGAQCPPCVAADVAFDGLLTTYQPTEFIGLQYHLHIPGADPLTNTASLARQTYYGTDVRGTPSTFFNGKSEAGGGGPMGNSEAKYNEYRRIIDKTLETTSGAKIALSATRAGDQIKIVATAELTEKSAGAKSEGGQTSADAKAGKSSKEPPKRMLRLALTEESVHYVGGNKLRYHHHVVRAFPGGTNGIELQNGKGNSDISISVAGLKLEIENYLSEFSSTKDFPNPLPEIKLDKLAVVAFVQDDGDKSVIQAVSVPVKAVTP